MSETWVIEKSPIGRNVIYITKEGANFGEEIAVVYGGNMEHAHLIKAAPKMRDALEACRNAMRADNPADGWKEIIEAADAALAEANGETE